MYPGDYLRLAVHPPPPGGGPGAGGSDLCIGGGASRPRAPDDRRGGGGGLQAGDGGRRDHRVRRGKQQHAVQPSGTAGRNYRVETLFTPDYQTPLTSKPLDQMSSIF